MAFQSVPNTAVAEVLQSYPNSGIIQNNLYFEFPGGYDQDALQDLADSVAGFWGDFIQPHFSVSSTLVGVHVRGLENELDLEADADMVATIPGECGTGGIMPGNVALALKFTTGYVGRSARGRIYLGGWCEGNVVVNTINDTPSNAIRDAFRDDLSARVSPAFHVIVSRFHNGAPRSTAMTLPVTGYSYTDKRVDSQRRRLLHTS